MKLADIANKAGVSLTTVSRVVNGDPNVKTSTRTRILRTMEALNYYPNLHARSLAQGQSKTLGVLLSNLENPFFGDVYRRLESLAYEKGYDIVVSATHYDPERLRAGIRSMLGRRVAGIVAIESEIEPHAAEQLAEIGTPVVFFDVVHLSKPLPNIRLDYRGAVRQLVDYLYSLGHRRMAFIAYPRPLHATEARRCAFLDTTARLGVATQVVQVAQESFAGGRDATRELLRGGFGATAIVCVNDITAVGAIKELHEQGISTPREISVTGFDNVELAQYTTPSLTTIHIPRERIAELAFQAVIPDPEWDPTRNPDVLLDLELIVRQSTAPPPHA